ncbi:MAG: polysaccharide deacetylase family protein [Terriglobales bacterium]
MRTSLRAVLVSTFVVAAACAATAQLPASVIIQRLGYPANSRLLIIHSDDLGMSHSVNRAAFEALQKGWINSASIMVPCPWFGEAAEFARNHPEMDWGLHLTLTSEWKSYRWGPVSATPTPGLLDKRGYFPAKPHTVASHADAADVKRELRAQIEKARAAGVNFTHFDTHMGALLETPELYNVYQQVAHEYHVPNLFANAGSPRGKRSLEVAVDTLVISKDLQMRPFRSRRKWLKAYEHMLRTAKPGGIYQLILHLGYDDPELEAISAHRHWGARWRQADLDLVSNPEFRHFVHDQGFILVTWRDLARAITPPPAKSQAHSSAL